MDDFFRTQQSPRGDHQGGATFVSPPRNGPILPRRFTTESGRVPTLSSITTIPRTTAAAVEPQDFASTNVCEERGGNPPASLRFLCAGFVVPLS